MRGNEKRPIFVSPQGCGKSETKNKMAIITYNPAWLPKATLYAIVLSGPNGYRKTFGTSERKTKSVLVKTAQKNGEEIFGVVGEGEVSYKKGVLSLGDFKMFYEVTNRK